MAIERTLAIVKPDGVQKHLIGKVLTRIEEEGLTPVAIRMAQLSQADAEGFYAVHRERPFFRDLIAFMTSGPVVLMALEGEGAIAKWRGTMGATDPAKADEGTLRKLYADGIERNVVHGSDAPETARFEIGWFFRGMEIV